MSRSDSHFIPNSCANRIASSGERAISSVMALTRELSMRRGAAEAGIAAAIVVARKVRRTISYLKGPGAHYTLVRRDPPGHPIALSITAKEEYYAVDLHRSGIDRGWYGAVVD